MLNKKEIKKDIKQLLMFHDIDEFSNEDYKYLVNNIVEYITDDIMKKIKMWAAETGARAPAPHRARARDRASREEA